MAWRHRPSDLAPFSRGDGPGGSTTPARRPSRLRLLGRLAQAGVTEGLADHDPQARLAAGQGEHGARATSRSSSTMRELELVTVCEDAGCPNIFECWADGTATFMINGERCTRACGFCLVDTSKPLALTPTSRTGSPRPWPAWAWRTRWSRRSPATTCADGGAAAFAATIRAIRRRRPGAAVEVLIPDCKGDAAALDAIFDARPDVLNHNLETVARLAAGGAAVGRLRPRASACWPGPSGPGLTTKCGLILGLGETDDEVVGALADLAASASTSSRSASTCGPTTHHLPVARWVAAGTVRRAEAGRRGHGHPPRRGVAADPQRATTPSKPPPIQHPTRVGSARALNQPRDRLCTASDAG